MPDYFYPKLLDEISLGICLLKTNGEVIFVNSALKKMFLIDKESKALKNIENIFPRTFIANLASQNIKIPFKAKHLDIKVESLIKKKKYYYNVSLIPIRDDLENALIIIDDLTTEKQNYFAELKECTFLKGVINSLPSCIYWLDDELAINGYNNKLQKALEIKDSEHLKGQKICDVELCYDNFIKINTKELKTENQDLITGKKAAINKIVTLKNKQGTTKYIKEQKIPILDRNKIIGLLANFEDITDLKEVETEVLKTNALLSTILNNIPNGVFVINDNLEIDDYNLSVVRLFGVEDLEVYKHKKVSQTPFKIFSKNGDTENKKVLNGETILDQTITIKINGRKRYFSYSKVPYIIDKRIVGIVASTADITYELEKKKHIEHMLRSITNMLDSINLGIIWINKSQKILGINKRIKDRLKLRDDFINHDLSELLDLVGIDDDTLEENEKILNQEVGSVQKRTNIVLHKQTIYYEQSKLAIYNEDEEIQGLAIILKDISDEIKQAENLKLTLDQLDAVLETSPNPIFWKDEKLKYVGINAAYERVFSRKKEEIIGFRDSDIDPQNSKYDQLEKLALKSDKAIESFININGKIFKINIARMKSGGKITGVMAVLNDVTEERKVHDELEYTSYHDKLTDLFNRSYFEKMKLQLKNANSLPISVVMIDVNGLKLMNDAFGHASGDKLLKCVAKRINDNFKKGIVSRIGGDEFAVILPKTSYVKAIDMTKKLISDLETTKVNGLTVSISKGVATKERHEQLLVDVINLADAKMYSDKLTTKSKNRVQTINEILEEIYKEMPEEKSHSLKVSYYAGEIAKNYGLDEKEVALVKDIGKYHDIGKIGIDKKLLVKKTKLTKANWIELKRHSEIGYAILNTSDKFVPYAKAVLNHHERFDGTGYPEGLKGLEIPIYSRIIAVADAISSMSEDHVYRKKFPLSKIIEELKNNRNTQFDPVFANIAIALLEKRGLNFNEKE